MSISQRFYEAIKIKLLAKKNHIPNSGQSTLEELFLLWSYKLHFKYTKFKNGMFIVQTQHK